MNLTIEQIIAQVESKNCVCAIRFEPGIKIFDLPTLKKIVSANVCSMDTAKELYATSYGKFQILGETLYSTLGYTKPVQVFFADETEQEVMFRKFISIHGICNDGTILLSNPVEREKFARFYNGPGNISDYCERIVEAGEFLMKK